MARGDVDTDASADLSPVIAPDPLDLRLSLATIVHWADSTGLRRDVMARVAFPVDDMGMFLVVNQLSYNGAMRPVDLSLALGQTATNMSKIVGRLVRTGLAVRVPAPDDDRGVLVALTDQGRRIGERIMSTAESNMRTLLADWSPAEIEDLRRMMARLARVHRSVSERRAASA
ncbi:MULTISPECIES: MarR family winged helix-turn-helix transcriptional regulator [Microbacterium]|uniref:DNA-binding transcriptional repressor MarR n=1 Tax=Microbacterium trichothecenolyticum TaxID=69370 RepID=A0A0M2H727_MICTR|nr:MULTISPECIES: MarR family transcriptional regulator [Microbacterium]KJL40352.1 DNA-binding transcriptional repressor MarR [Microbacterium trichothecenolyticum]MDR7188282.1 DNA-binding MarR family transcriptional regulator [Microbacterium sp. BE35]